MLDSIAVLFFYNLELEFTIKVLPCTAISNLKRLVNFNVYFFLAAKIKQNWINVLYG